MKIDRKGVAIAQVFVFIVAAITFAFITIFGYQAISDFISSGEEVAFIQFKNDLEGSVKKIYTEYGAVRVETYRLPIGYERICFVNFDFLGGMDGLREISPYAYDLYDTALEDRDRVDDDKTLYELTQQNVFLMPPSQHKIKTIPITIMDYSSGNQIGYLCEEINKGRFSIVLQGKGSHTEIASPRER